MKTLAAAGALAFALAGVTSSWAADVSPADTNQDGSIDMTEAHTAAAKKFDKLDTEHSGKLTEKQLSPMSAAMTEMARQDKDHSIDKEEYMAGVDKAFKEADPKGAGKLDAAALKTPAGKRFLELVE